MLCDRKMSVAYGSSNLLKHLRNQHGANKQKQYGKIKRESKAELDADAEASEANDDDEDPEVATAIKRLEMSVAAANREASEDDNNDENDEDYDPKEANKLPKNSRRRSKVWDYFEIMNSDQARCLTCLKVNSYKGGCTSNLRKHYEKKHGLRIQAVDLYRPKGEKDEDDNPKTRKIISEVWRFFDKVPNEGAVQCTLCPRKLMYRGSSTSALRKHLLFKHGGMVASLEPAIKIRQTSAHAEREYPDIMEENETEELRIEPYEETIETVDMKDVAATNDAGLPSHVDIMCDDSPFIQTGRRERSLIWTYFDRPAGTNLAICRLCSCKMTFTKGRSTSNFRKHIRTKHKELALNLGKMQPHVKGEAAEDDRESIDFADDTEFASDAFEDEYEPKLAFVGASQKQKLDHSATGNSNRAKNHIEPPPAANCGRHPLDAALLNWLSVDLSVEQPPIGYQIPLQSVSQQDHFQSKYADVVAHIRRTLQEADFVALTAAIRVIHCEKYMAITAQYISRKDWRLHACLLNCGRLEAIAAATAKPAPMDTAPAEETPPEADAEPADDDDEMPPIEAPAFGADSIMAFLQRTCDFWHIGDKVFVLVAGIGDDDDAIPRGDNRDDPFNVATLGWSQMQCLDQRLSECVRFGMELNDFVCMRLKIHSIVDLFETDGNAIDKFFFFQRQRDHSATAPMRLLSDETAAGCWRKTLQMLKKLSALQEPLDASLEILRHDTRLSTGEWMAIRDVARLLQSFQTSFDELCSDTEVSTSKAIVMAHGLQSQLANHRCSEYRTELSKELADQVQRSIRSHMADMECDLLLAVCTFLDPRFKRCGFVLPKAFEICRTHMETLASRVHLDLDELRSRETVKPTGSDPDSVWYWLDKQVAQQHLAPATATVLARREMQFFVDLPAVDRQTAPLQWWRDTGRVSCPRLAQVARKYMAMPATCAASKRALDQVQRLQSLNWTVHMNVTMARKATFLKENLRYFD